MNIFLAFALFTVIVLLYWVIAELFTMLFRFTGLPDDKARFQVMSLLTGCGFTTRESEMVLAFKPRRRIARITMLFGYVFNITIVSAFVNVFLSLKLAQAENLVLGILIPLSVALLIFIMLRIRAVRAWGDHLFENLADRILHQTSVNTVLLLDHIGLDSIAQVSIKEMPENLRDKPLSETGLKADKNILIMLVERHGKKPEPPDAKTIFQVGDKLTVFGDYKAICGAFRAKEHFTDSV
jgi:hypothetical protein